MLVVTEERRGTRLLNRNVITEVRSILHVKRAQQIAIPIDNRNMYLHRLANRQTNPGTQVKGLIHRLGDDLASRHLS